MNKITRDKAMRILKLHGMRYTELKDFINTLGNKQMYDRHKLYWWLGY